MPKSSINIANESQLLNDILRYIAPFINKRINKNAKNKKQGKLEELIRKEESNLKTHKLALTFFEDLVLLFSARKDVKLSSKIKSIDKNKIKDAIDYSIFLERKKENKGNFAYSISIDYQENGNEEKLNVKVKFDNNKNLNDDNNKKEYSFTITREKNNDEKNNYAVSLVYENNYGEERLSITYKSTIGTYLNRRQKAMHDFSDRVPGKHLENFPVSGNEGLYGFTFLGDVKAWRRDDLTGSLAKMVEIHESIHTPDEYETRVLTSWIMSRERGKYIK